MRFDETTLYTASTRRLISDSLRPNGSALTFPNRPIMLDLVNPFRRVRHVVDPLRQRFAGPLLRVPVRPLKLVDLDLLAPLIRGAIDPALTVDDGADRALAQRCLVGDPAQRLAGLVESEHGSNLCLNGSERATEILCVGIEDWHPYSSRFTRA
jgi:hypothetical protein